MSWPPEPRSAPGELAVVVCYTRYEGVGVAECLALMRAFEDVTAADVEAARLNAARPNDKVEYFVKILGAGRWSTGE